MLYSWRFFIVTIAIWNIIAIVMSEELIEMHCVDELHCRQFQHDSNRVTCDNGVCRCTSATNESTECTPITHKISNMIGGMCPCMQPNAECNEAENACYCAPSHIPSTDMRRCIKNTVPLDASCEVSLQCKHHDTFAECNDQLKKCTCREGFINQSGTCYSIVGKPDYKCKAESDCKVHGNATCDPDQTKCICRSGYVSSLDSEHCIALGKYNENCIESTQCEGTLGPGGECQNNTCICDGQHFPYEIKSETDQLRIVCERVVELGQYCHDDRDCYQRQFSADDQTMRCYYSECNCKWGYNSIDNGICVKGNAAALPLLGSFAMLVWFLVIFGGGKVYL